MKPCAQPPLRHISPRQATRAGRSSGGCLKVSGRDLKSLRFQNVSAATRIMILENMILTMALKPPLEPLRELPGRVHWDGVALPALCPSPLPGSTVPAGCPSSDSSGALEGCHFNSFKSLTEVFEFQTHYLGTTNKYCLRNAPVRRSQKATRNSIELPSRAPRNAAAHRALHRPPCSAVSRAPPTNDSSGALERGLF